MKKSNKLKIVFIFFTMAMSFMWLNAIAFTDCNTKQSAPGTYSNGLYLSDKLPSPRAVIPPSLRGHIVTKEKTFKKQTKANLDCNTTSLCASFDVTTKVEDVSAWMGFNFKDKTGSYFLATYGQEAVYLGENTYATEKWDKGHFWINIGEGIVPFPIQPRFVGIDKESGSEWHVVDYIGYQRPDIDYTNYTDNLSMSSLVLLINPTTKKVEKFHLEYYDENDEYSGEYDIKVGEKVQATFLAFKKGEEDKDYLVSIEGITAITSPITFEYKEQYPGIDFGCTFCGELDFAKVEFQYIFEEFGDERAVFTDPQSIETKETNNSTASNLSSSSSKSVPISGFWMFFILSMFIAVVALKNDNRLHKV